MNPRTVVRAQYREIRNGTGRARLTDARDETSPEQIFDLARSIDLINGMRVSRGNN